MKTRATFRPDHPSPLEVRAVPATSIFAPLLEGSADGTVTVRIPLHRPAVEHLAASGTLNGYGTIQIQGDLRPGKVGVDTQPLGGLLTIRDAGGTLVLRVRGVQVFGNDGPIRLSYTILGGSGHDRGTRGSGTVSLTEAAGPIPLDPGSAVTRAAHLEFGDPPIVDPLPLALNGVLRGEATQTVGPVDNIGTIHGTGTYAGTGPIASAAATFDQTSFPDETATVTLSGPDGTLTLAISRPTAGSSARRYEITAGTGAWQNYRGGGTARFETGGPIVSRPPIGGSKTYSEPFILILGDGGGQFTVLPL